MASPLAVLGRSSYKNVRDFVRQHITVRVSAKAQTSADTILDIALYASSNGLTIEGAVDDLRTVHNRKVPSADTVMAYLKDQTKDQIHEEFLLATDTIVQTARKHRLLPPGRAPMTVAIDFHDIPYYGDKSDEMVVRGKAKVGTCSFFRMATVYIVIKGKRYTLAVVPVAPLQDTDEVVGELLTIANRWVRVRFVLLDRGFYSVRVIKLLKSKPLLFLMPAVRREGLEKKIKEAWDESKRTFTHEIKSQDHGSATVNILIAEVLNPKIRFSEDPKVTFKKKVLGFAANLIPTEVSAVKHLTELYRKRFGIESSYRMMKQVRAKTCSKSFRLRYFFFLLSVTLYNLWVYLNQVQTRIVIREGTASTKKIRQHIMKSQLTQLILEELAT